MKIRLKRWGKWFDISTGDYADNIYIVQARRNKNGELQMRVETARKAYNCVKPSLEQLKQVKYE